MPDILVAVLIVAIVLVLFNRYCFRSTDNPATAKRHEDIRWVVNSVVVTWLVLWLVGIAPGPFALRLRG